VARGLAEAEDKELSEFGGVNFDTNALAALMAYREYALGKRSAFGIAAWYWLEVGRSAWLFYDMPITAYSEAEKAKAERSAAVEELVAEGLRRLFLKPGADHHSDFIKLLGSGKLALELEEEKTRRKTESYVFRLYRVEEGGGLKELGIELWISKVVSGAAGVCYNLQSAGYAGFRSEEGAPLGVVNSVPAELRLVYVEEEAPNFFRHLHHLYNHRHVAVRRVAKATSHRTTEPSGAHTKTSETRYTPPKPHSHPQLPQTPTTRRTRPRAPDGRPPVKRQESPPSRPEATQCYASSPQPLAAPARRPPTPRPQPASYHHNAVTLYTLSSPPLNPTYCGAAVYLQHLANITPY
jgi:hypothetical protein